jgi:hypothetical protein
LGGRSRGHGRRAGFGLPLTELVHPPTIRGAVARLALLIVTSELSRHTSGGARPAKMRQCGRPPAGVLSQWSFSSAFPSRSPYPPTFQPETLAGPYAPLTAEARTRVLLVEDHPDSAEILTVLLEGNGHEVFAVGTAKDALRA